MEKRSNSARTPLPEALVRELRRMHAQDFAPLAISLGAQIHVSTRFQRTGSQWQTCTSDQSPKAVFSIPDGIDTPTPNAEVMAQAVMECWTPGPVTTALRPLVIALLQLGQRFPIADTLNEEVSDSVYVMF
jgi:hypothetical protein